MVRTRLPILLFLLLITAVLVCSAPRCCFAARASEELLPNTTKGYVSIPKLDVLRQKFEQTQWGQMANDPVMKPFVDDIKKQIESKLNKTNAKINISWEELSKVQGGEVCLAAVQPWDQQAAEKAVTAAGDRAVEKAKAAGKKEAEISKIRKEAEAAASLEQEKLRREQHAVVLMADVTGHATEAQALVEKVVASLLEKGATKDKVQVGGIEMVALTIPVDKDKGTTQKAYYCVHQDQLFAVDNLQIAELILGRLSGPVAADALVNSVSFQTVIKRSRDAFREAQPQLRWYIEPFGFVEVIRAIGGGRKKRGMDPLKVLAKQGFSAIQGVGGCLALSTGEHELLQRIYVYAPPVQRPAGKANKDRYDLAARMLDFPNSLGLQPQAWVPRELATSLTMNWKMRDAFWYSETLVNAFAEDEVFRDVLKSIETDPNGPQVDLDKELISYLGTRATLIADCHLPVTTKSERVLVAIEVTNVDAVSRAIKKVMESDPEARKREHNGHIIWEIVNEGPIEVETVKIDGAGFGFDLEEEAKPVEEEEKRFRPNAAFCVAKGHLLVSSHVDYIQDLLDRPADAETLEADGEYQLIAGALDKIGAGEDCVRFFSRTDEAYRTTYELLRQGKMPEAKSLFGGLLNRIFEPEEEGVLRKQAIDGSKLPDYQIVRRYLGPTGFYARTEADGWSFSGCLLNKEAR